MLTSSVLERSNIVAAWYDGPLSTDEMSDFRRRINDVVAEHGTARLLAEYGDVDLDRIEPGAVWEHLKISGALRNVDKVAIVVGLGRIHRLSGVAEAVAPVDVEVFDPAERFAVMTWLRE